GVVVGLEEPDPDGGRQGGRPGLGAAVVEGDDPAGAGPAHGHALGAVLAHADAVAVPAPEDREGPRGGLGHRPGRPGPQRDGDGQGPSGDNGSDPAALQHDDLPAATAFSGQVGATWGGLERRGPGGGPAVTAHPPTDPAARPCTK